MRLPDVVYYNNGRGASDGNNYWKKFTVPHGIYTAFMLVALSLLAGCSALFAVGFPTGTAVLLNLLPCAVLMLFVYFVSGRAWIAFTVTAIAVYSLAAFRLIGELTVSWKAAALLVCFAAGLLASIFLMRGVLKVKPLRICGSVVTALAALLLMMTLYYDTEEVNGFIYSFLCSISVNIFGT